MRLVRPFGTSAIVMFQGSVSLRSTTITADREEVKQYLQNLKEDLEKLKDIEEPYVFEGEKSPTVKEYLEQLNNQGKPIKHRRRSREHKVSRFYYKLRESLKGPFRKTDPHREISPKEAQKDDDLDLYPPCTTFAEEIQEEPDQGGLGSLDHRFSRISRASRISEESVLLSQRRSLSRYSSVIRYPSSVVEVYIGGDLFDNHSDFNFNRQFSFARPRSTNGSDDNYSMASLVIPGSQTVPIRRDSIPAFNASSRRSSRLHRHLSRTLADIEQGSGSTSNEDGQPEREHPRETHSTGVYSLISDPTSGLRADRPMEHPMEDEGSAPRSTRTFNYTSAFTDVSLGQHSQEALQSSIYSDDEDDDDQVSYYSILQSPPHFHRDDSVPPHLYV
ncbi:hypothetical protein KL943_004545 [Ogataea angusta]|nr:hypothetical protein KL943_004545 [Ogataea angusta]